MLTDVHLATLTRVLHNQRVLTVYLRGTDPALPATGARAELAAGLAAQRATLAGAPALERQAFERCMDVLDGLLPDDGAAPASPGWVAWITASGAPRVQALPVPVPTSVWWSDGPRLTPYLAVRSLDAPVMLAVVDSTHAVLHLTNAGGVARVAALTAHARSGAPTPPTGAAGANRLATELADRIAVLAPASAWIVLGGTPEAVRDVRSALPLPVAGRTVVLSSLSFGASELELWRAAQEGAALLRADRDRLQARLIATASRSGGPAVLGLSATRQALNDGDVRELLLERTAMAERPEDCEWMVRRALAVGAPVQVLHLSRTSAAILRDGVGAVLQPSCVSPAPVSVASQRVGLPEPGTIDGVASPAPAPAC